MNLAASRPTTQTERIFALEEARRADGERLEKIEKKVDDIHNLLVNVRGFKWVIDGGFKYIGQIGTAAAVIYAGWKFFTGH